MDLDALVVWLNQNSGAATVLGSIVAVVLGGIGWLIARIFFKTNEVAPSPDTSRSIVKDSSTLERILSSKTVRVGCLIYPPFMSIKGNSGSLEVTGLYPEILREVFRQEQIAIEWKAIRWSEILDDLRSKKVDLVCSIFLTSLRTKQGQFCGLMHRIGVMGLCRIDESRLSGQDDLLNPQIQIGVMSGEIGWEYAVDNLGMGFDSNRFKVLDDYDISRTVDLLEAGAVDVVLADALTCNTWLKSGSQRTEKFKLVLENDRLNVCDNGFLARKGDEDLCDWLEKRLRLARETPEIALLESDILESLAGIVRRREI